MKIFGCWHRWGKWEEKGLLHTPPEGVLNPWWIVYIKERTCEKCGIVEARNIAKRRLKLGQLLEYVTKIT